MSESEWLGCIDPTPMLEFLRGKASDRKLRLFALGNAQALCGSLTDSRSREACRIMERYVDGEATSEECRIAVRSAHAAKDSAAHEQPGSSAYFAAHTAYYAVGSFDGYAAASNASSDDGKTAPLLNSQTGRKVHLLRCIFGNPFRPDSLDPAWLTPTVLNLAQSAYDERSLPSGHLDTDRLAILSDALEEAGCDDADILGHLRGAGPHVRGCHVLDLLLSKK
jgi:hypothetical protein